MTPRLSLLLFAYLLFSFSLATEICPTVEEFEKANKNFGGKGYSEYKSSFQGNILKYIAENSVKLGSGGYGQVYEIKDVPNAIMKAVEIKDPDNKNFLLREVEILRYFCNRKDEDFAKYIKCKSKLIAPFHGCIIERNGIFEFQEKMTWDLSNKLARDAYRDLSPFQRVVVMLDIIDRFIEFHKENIVHSDIKPANIMLKNPDFSDIRIIDFGMVNKVGYKFLGGTSGYKPPEAYHKDAQGKKLLSFQSDVYALGMTFAAMEGHFYKTHQLIIDGCFKVKEDVQACGDAVNEGLKFAFKDKKGLFALLPVIMKAVDVDKTKRFKDMKEFADEILKVFRTLEGADAFIEELKRKVESGESTDEFPSYWKNQLAPRKRIIHKRPEIEENVEKPKVENPVEKPKVEENVVIKKVEEKKPKGGIGDRILNFFGCGAKKPKKNKKNVVHNHEDDDKENRII